MSEYITLDSNVKSLLNYEQNSIAEFRTNLGRPVSLIGNWVVGLSEISYTKSWYNVLNEHQIILFDEMGKVYTPEHNYLSQKKFIISEGFYETPQKLILEINEILKKFSTLKPPKLIYNDLNNYVWVEPGKINNIIKVYPDLGFEIENILGLRNRNKKQNIYSTIGSNSGVAEYVFKDSGVFKNEVFKAFHPVEITGGFHSVFLYTDIVYPSLIGDTCASILRVVDVPKKYKFGDNVHLNYDVSHYRPLILNEFESIEISIKDDTGQNIPFKFGRCSLTLHLKQI